MNLMPNFSKLSKFFPGLRKPWVEYLDAVPGGDERERRFDQLLAVNFLFGDLESGGTTIARFLGTLMSGLIEVSHLVALKK